MGRGRRRREEKIGSRLAAAADGAGAAAGKAGLAGRAGENGDVKAAADASSSRRRGCGMGSDEEEGEEEDARKGRSEVGGRMRPAVGVFRCEQERECADMGSRWKPLLFCVFACARCWMREQ